MQHSVLGALKLIALYNVLYIQIYIIHKHTHVNTPTGMCVQCTVYTLHRHISQIGLVRGGETVGGG